jgi:hypothetical protein
LYFALLLTLTACSPNSAAAPIAPAASQSLVPISLSFSGVPAGSRSVMVFARAQGVAAPPLPSFLGDVVESASSVTPAACVGNSASAHCMLTTFAPIGNDLFGIAFYDTAALCTTVCTTLPLSATLLLGGFASGIVLSAGAALNVTLGVSLLPPGAGRVFPGSPWTPLPLVAPPNGPTLGGTLEFGLPAGSVATDAQISLSTTTTPSSLLAGARFQEALRSQTGISVDSVFVYGFGFTLVGTNSLTSSLALTGTTLTVNNTLAAQLATWRTSFAPGQTPILNVAAFDGNTYTAVGTLPFAIRGNVLELSAGETGITQSGSFVVYVPFTKPPSLGAGTAILVIPTAAPIACSPARLTLTTGQTTIVKCSEPGYVGPFAPLVADPTIASAFATSQIPSETFAVTGLHAGTTLLSLRDKASSSVTVPIDVTSATSPQRIKKETP